MPTPHIAAEKNEIARTVLMPGDPLRAKYIAEHWLSEAVLVNEIRGMLAYTGSYKGQAVTVMGSGMGLASIGIYSYELFKFYDVDRIIRVGSAGSYIPELDLYDIVLGKSCYSESTFGLAQNGDSADVKFADSGLNEAIIKAAQTLGTTVTSARIHSSDVFYRVEDMPDYRELAARHGCACVEMESFALFHNAQVTGKQAACLLTISDAFTTGAKATAKERQEAFGEMIELALEATVLVAADTSCG